MATTTETPRRLQSAQGETRLLLRNISWATFEALVEDLGDQHIRLAYDRGDLELMTTSPEHEWLKKRLGHIIENILVELRLPFEPLGESLWRRAAAARGLQADECYYLDPEKLRALAGRPPSRPDDPLPDLALEIDLSRPLVDRPAIYAALGIPEIWRYDGQTVKIERLRDDGTYEAREQSEFLPVRTQEVAEWTARAEGVEFIAWLGQLRDWIRDVLRPRVQGGE